MAVAPAAQAQLDFYIGQLGRQDGQTERFAYIGSFSGSIREGEFAQLSTGRPITEYEGTPIAVEGMPLYVMAGYQFNPYIAFEARLGTWQGFCIGPPDTPAQECFDENVTGSLGFKLGFKPAHWLRPYIYGGYSLLNLASERVDEGDNLTAAAGFDLNLATGWSLRMEYAKDIKSFRGIELTTTHISAGVVLKF